MIEIKEGDTIIFKEENDVPFYQDMQYDKRGLPAGLEFEVYNIDLPRNWLRLKADGFGHLKAKGDPGAYGNGAIAISFEYLEERKDQFDIFRGGTKMEEKKPNPVMYLFINKSLGMSPGKLAAQVAHAACLAQRGSKPELVEAWYEYGFYTKLVLEARDAEHIRTIEKYLNDPTRNIKTFMVIDEGRTEIKKHTITALGVEVIDKNELGPIFKEFSLFKPELNIKVSWNE